MIYQSVNEDYNEQNGIGSVLVGSVWMLSESKGKWIICELL